MRLRLLILVAFLLAALSGASAGYAARTATCTADEKAANAAKLTAFQSRIVADRKAYFRKHKSPAQRKAFVKRQQARLKALQGAAACTVSTPPPPATQLTVTVGSNVSAAERDAITRAANFALAFDAKLGATPAKVDLRVYGDAESAAQGYAAATGTPIDQARQIWQFSTATGGKDGLIVVNTGARGWSESDPSHRAKIIAHEIFHVLQADLAGAAWTFSGPADIPGGGPRWLIEGAAEVVGFGAIADAQLLSYSLARAENVGNVRYATGPLSDYATQAGIDRHPDAQYNLFFVAVDYLTRAKGFGALVQLWTAIGHGSSWPEAFRATFGTSVEEFYADFERYRATL